MLDRWMRYPTSHYDEMMKPDGQYRKSYQDIIPIVRKISKNQHKIKKFDAKSLKAFSNDNRLYYIPRMLTRHEHDLLYRGVHQRARALHAFIQDHYFGQKDYLKAKIISPSVMKDLISRSYEYKFHEKINKSSTSQYGFLYGPDIIRGPRGDFYVCEDNIGYVGGMGDIVIAKDTLLSHFPKYKQFIDSSSPKLLYQQMAESYRKMIPQGYEIVLLHYPSSVTSDHEEARIVDFFEKLGIRCLIIPIRDDMKKQDWTLYVSPDKHVYVVNKSKNIELPVGLVILDCESYDIDPQNVTVLKKVILDEVQNTLKYYLSAMKKPKKNGLNEKHILKYQKRHDKLSNLLNKTYENPSKRNFDALTKILRKNHRRDFHKILSRGFPGLLDAYFDEKVFIINGPGFDFLGDKNFCGYVNRLIKFYLQEKPLLKTIPSINLGKHPRAISYIFDHPEIQKHVVIKGCVGRGGDSVYVGPKISRSEFLAIKDKILKNPSSYIVQQYIPMSQVDNHLVDLRVICSIASHQGVPNIVVGSTFWGRGVSMKGTNGKVNISDKGVEFTVCQMA